MIYVYGGNLKIYMYIIIDIVEIIVFFCINEKKKIKRKKRNINEMKYISG